MTEQDIIDYARFLYISNKNKITKEDAVRIATQKIPDVVRDVCTLFEVTTDEYVNNLIKQI